MVEQGLGRACAMNYRGTECDVFKAAFYSPRPRSADHGLVQQFADGGEQGVAGVRFEEQTRIIEQMGTLLEEILAVAGGQG